MNNPGQESAWRGQAPPQPVELLSRRLRVWGAMALVIVMTMVQADFVLAGSTEIN